MEENKDVISQLRAAVAERNKQQIRVEQTIKLARTQGKSWDAIARELGTTKQNAWEKYRYLDKFNH